MTQGPGGGKGVGVRGPLRVQERVKGSGLKCIYMVCFIFVSDAAVEMTDRILSMLSQYLLSNQSLTLNESFQVYLKVLSIDHSNYHASNPPRYDQDF